MLPWGVPIFSDAQPALEKPADVVVHSTSSYLPSVMDQLLECIAAGCCVVSTCEELAYPFRKHPELSKKLEAAAIEEGVALVGTGVNPGFVMDKLALTLSAVSQRIDWLSAVRIVDASKRRLPLQKKIGAGMTPDEFRAQVAAGVIKHHGLPESIAMVADGLGFALDDISETIEPVIAEEAVKTEFLEVAAGQVAGVHQIARGSAGGKEKIFMELQDVRGRQASRRYRRAERRAASHSYNSRRHARRRGHSRGRRQRHTCNSCRQRRPAHLARSAAVIFSGYAPALAFEPCDQNRATAE